MASIRKRGNSYLLVVSMGYTPDGRRRNPQQKTVKPPKSTLVREKQDIERFKPYLGSYKLVDLRPEHFRSLYTKLRKQKNKATGKPLFDAMEGGYIDHNPAWRTYKYAGQKKEKKIADDETVKKADSGAGNREHPTRNLLQAHHRNWNAAWRVLCAQVGGHQLRRAEHPRLPQCRQNDGGRDHRESAEDESRKPVCVLLRRDGKPAPRIRSLLRRRNGALRPAKADERRLCIPEKGHEITDDALDVHLALQENPQGKRSVDRSERPQPCATQRQACSPPAARMSERSPDCSDTANRRPRWTSTRMPLMKTRKPPARLCKAAWRSELSSEKLCPVALCFKS